MQQNATTHAAMMISVIKPPYYLSLPCRNLFTLIFTWVIVASYICIGLGIRDRHGVSSASSKQQLYQRFGFGLSGWSGVGDCDRVSICVVGESRKQQRASSRRPRPMLQPAALWCIYTSNALRALFPYRISLCNGLTAERRCCLVQLKPVGIILFVFCCVVISLLAHEHASVILTLIVYRPPHFRVFTRTYIFLFASGVVYLPHAVRLTDSGASVNSAYCFILKK